VNLLFKRHHCKCFNVVRFFYCVAVVMSQFYFVVIVASPLLSPRLLHIFCYVRL
jgi:hypothetical protein